MRTFHPARLWIPGTFSDLAVLGGCDDGEIRTDRICWFDGSEWRTRVVDVPTDRLLISGSRGYFFHGERGMSFVSLEAETGIHHIALNLPAGARTSWMFGHDDPIPTVLAASGDAPSRSLSSTGGPAPFRCSRQGLDTLRSLMHRTRWPPATLSRRFGARTTAGRTGRNWQSQCRVTSRTSRSPKARRSR
jgi:hypothetical protein